MARILVLTDMPELDFFDRWSRARDLWEFKPLEIASFDDYSFFDIVVLYSSDSMILDMIYDHAIKEEVDLPVLTILPLDNLRFLTKYSPADFLIDGSPSSELNVRINRIVEHSSEGTLRKTHVVRSVTEESTPIEPHPSVKNSAPKSSAYEAVRDDKVLGASSVDEKRIVKEMSFNSSGYGVMINGKSVNLTYREFEMLTLLVKNSNRTFARIEILEALGDGEGADNTRVIDVHIRRIRSKLGPQYGNYIKTVHNVGYTWRTD